MSGLADTSVGMATGTSGWQDIGFVRPVSVSFGCNPVMSRAEVPGCFIKDTGASKEKRKETLRRFGRDTVTTVGEHRRGERIHYLSPCSVGKQKEGYNNVKEEVSASLAENDFFSVSRPTEKRLCP